MPGYFFPGFLTAGLKLAEAASFLLWSRLPAPVHLRQPQVPLWVPVATPPFAPSGAGGRKAP